MPTCANCGNERAEKYCPQCGQRVGDRLALRTFIGDVADDQLGVDAKIPRTLKALFFKPGLLTSEFVNGRVARYIPPFRLYLLTSLLFFVLLSILSNRSDWAERAEREMDPVSGDSAAPPADTSRGLNVGVTVRDKAWINDVQVNLPWKWLDERIEANLQGLSKLPPSVAMRRVWQAAIEEAPKVMFLMLPVFALLLKLLYYRRSRFYIAHFIFALHVHSFTFILFTIALLSQLDFASILIAIILPVYTYMAMKRVYQQGHMKTFLKWAALTGIYSVLLGIGLAFAFVWALAAGPGVA